MTLLIALASFPTDPTRRCLSNCLNPMRNANISLLIRTKLNNANVMYLFYLLSLSSQRR